MNIEDNKVLSGVISLPISNKANTSIKFTDKFFTISYSPFFTVNSVYINGVLQTSKKYLAEEGDIVSIILGYHTTHDYYDTISGAVSGSGGAGVGDPHLDAFNYYRGQYKGEKQSILEIHTFYFTTEFKYRYIGKEWELLATSLDECSLVSEDTTHGTVDNVWLGDIKEVAVPNKFYSFPNEKITFKVTPIGRYAVENIVTGTGLIIDLQQDEDGNYFFYNSVSGDRLYS